MNKFEKCRADVSAAGGGRRSGSSAVLSRVFPRVGFPGLLRIMVIGGMAVALLSGNLGAEENEKADLVTRVCWLPCVTYANDWPRNPRDPFAAPGQGSVWIHSPRVIHPRHVQLGLEEIGVVFPEGASASFDPRTSILVVTTIPDCLPILEKQVEKEIQWREEEIQKAKHYLSSLDDLSTPEAVEQAERVKTFEADLDEVRVKNQIRAQCEKPCQTLKVRFGLPSTIRENGLQKSVSDPFAVVSKEESDRLDLIMSKLLPAAVFLEEDSEIQFDPETSEFSLSVKQPSLGQLEKWLHNLRKNQAAHISRLKERLEETGENKEELSKEIQRLERDLKKVRSLTIVEE